MPKLQRFKTRNLRRNQLMDQWKITTRKANLIPVPSDDDVKKIRKTFDDMVESLGQKDTWRQLKIEHKKELEAAYNGKRMPRKAQMEFDKFFGTIAHFLELSPKQTAQRVWSDEKLDNFIDMYKETLHKHVFPLYDKPEIIKEKFVGGLNHTLRNEFHQLQKKHGRGFWNEVGAAGTPWERSEELSAVLEDFYEKVSESLGILMENVIDLIWESKSPSISEPDEICGDRQWSFQYIDNPPDEPDDDDKTVVGHADDTGAFTLSI
ncbi:hypothetical protein DM02DRAFT_630975 [Periconia macrospinosa]|uniref:Uncharacterized protein n=1 Tax=Periconia macrospinosa TaxID=97972 RepID=A0A2V1DK39_9PLEO|nr:hypothetical protein DM02DRAFT_630975 [Periconia macrospinosa]